MHVSHKGMHVSQMGMHVSHRGMHVSHKGMSVSHESMLSTLLTPCTLASLLASPPHAAPPLGYHAMQVLYDYGRAGCGGRRGGLGGAFSAMCGVDPR